MHAAQQAGMSGQFDEQFLQHITRIALVSGEVQQKSKQRLPVVIVKTPEIEKRRHALQT